MLGSCLALALSFAQCRALRTATAIGGRRLAALIWVETSFCTNKRNPRNHSVHGCGQLNEQAVVSVYGRQIAVFTLTYNDPLNMVLAENYLRRCEHIFGWPDALAAYYWGIPRARRMTHTERVHDPYTRAVLAKMARLEAAGA